jgi:hypothetical protein
LTAKLAGVAECPDAAIETARQKTGRQEQESPSCSAGSEVGTVNVGAGAGPAPYFAQGRVYLAGPYKGAPFSLAILTPAVAGPYDLGDVVVRAGLYINPETTQVTVKSDPIPTILDGIRLDVRTIAVRTGRPDFTLNPTDCEKMSVGGEALSVLGQSPVLCDPFQVGGCETLGFKPVFKVSTSGKTSRQDGASLHVLLTYPNAPQGSQANIKSVHVELPKALPSRLSTLKEACLSTVFDQNPAGCPALSKVGSARAITPVLAVALEGPAYFVSHGGAKFRELVVVLQVYSDGEAATYSSSASFGAAALGADHELRADAAAGTELGFGRQRELLRGHEDGPRQAQGEHPCQGPQEDRHAQRQDHTHRAADHADHVHRAERCRPDAEHEGERPGLLSSEEGKVKIEERWAPQVEQALRQAPSPGQTEGLSALRAPATP